MNARRTPRRDVQSTSVAEHQVQAFPQRCQPRTEACSAVVETDSIVRDLDQNLGIYATIVTPGRVSVGDELVFV